MGAGWGFALAAGVDGWMKGSRLARENDEYETEKAYKDEKRARERKDNAEADSLKADLKQASRDVEVDQGANGKIIPQTMDNRDVGSPENAALPNGGLQDAGFAVAGKPYVDQASATAAAGVQNAPEAVNARLAKTYRAHGDVEKSMAIEQSGRAAELSKIQLGDMQWKRGLGVAMRSGHEGIANFVSQSEAGPMKGMKVQAVPSADGKTVTYSSIGPNGALVPVPGIGAFTNDQKGVTQAAWMLDQSIDPAARMAHTDAETARDLAQKNHQQSHDTQVEQFGQSHALAQTASTRAGLQADQTLAKGALELKDLERNSKIPPAIKTAVAGLQEEAKQINGIIYKAQADGSWDATTPGAKNLMERQAIINGQIGKHLAPYSHQDGAAPDPLGIRKPVPAAAAAPQGRSAGGSGRRASGADLSTINGALDAEKVDGRAADFVRSIYTQESGDGTNTTTSNRGAVGGMQIIPGTFKGVADKDWDINNKDHNARAGVRYAKEAWDKSGGDPVLAGAYYYGGPNGMAKAAKGVQTYDSKNPGNPGTIDYGKQVAARMASRATDAPPIAGSTPAMASRQGAITNPNKNFGPTKAAGMTTQGNIDLNARPVAQNKDGSVSTVRSISVEYDGKEVLIPTVSQDGQVLTDDEAVALYKRTGLHLGKFDSPEAATRYAQSLHKDQEKQYADKEPDPMTALYKKQVGEMNHGTRDSLSADVASWKARTDDLTAKGDTQKFNAAQASYLQSEKLKAQRDSKTIVASGR
ncbi:hypothetical protein RCH10_000756 [Variovorax sp. GrIS 2.14]|uniref:transglycosylase SLT domain-containing protein n=1 Tax=Variovorax sp. GrIS 2.14 TaxID=3071709 RepID=UPI0038F64E26